MTRHQAILAAALGLAAAVPAEAASLDAVGLSLGNMGNPFFVQIARGAEAKAKELGGAKVQVTALSADYDLNKQYSQIENFIASGANLIVLNAADPKAIEPAVRRAQAAGVVILAVDVGAAGADATVMTDNGEAGQLACQYIVDKLKGKGKVVIMNGPPVSSVVDRVAGCKAALAKAPGITVLSDSQNGKGTREGGLEVMIGLLTAFDQIDAVFTINDPQAIGADLAAKQLGRTELFITSVDGAPDIEAALKSDTLIEASAAQDPHAMASKAIEIGYDILQGAKPAKTTVLIPAKLVTRDNVGQYKGWQAK
ncbi:MAG: substrate-binding domain-containing protein [Azospirillum sp.]|nr:substrate-binding domain-containing protein [Azospirillum sp.]